MVKFYKCQHCGQIVIKMVDKNVPVVCCGEKMVELVPNTTDAANEKHVPVVTLNGNKVEVKVGSVTHPMTVEHHIDWIVLETNKGVYNKHLKNTDAPEATFLLAEDETVVAVYEHCNLHSLWVAK